MQFIVPQFIDVETKIIGPVTPKQFIILIITAGLIFLSYKLADFTLFIIEAVFLFGLGITLAFVKINNQPAYYFILSLIQVFKKPSIRVWKREKMLVLEKKIKKKKGEIEEVIIPRRALSSSKLSEVSLLVDTGGRYEEE
ncbi:hypothetical protein KKG58_01435 [Patescibacteria group bacterium]|nr:hypothetical protein [Patescibacteria group bacterium]